MSQSRTCTVLSFLLLAGSGTATAWDSALPLPAVAPGTFRPTAAATDETGRLWATGYAPTGVTVVRYETAGAPPTLVRGKGSSNQVPRQWLSLPGGMAGFDDSGGCSVLKYDTSGVLLWEQPVIPCSWPRWIEPNLWPAGADGSLWVRTSSGMLRLGRDGRVVTTVDFLPYHADIDTADPRDGRLVTSVANADGSSLVAPYDRSGTRLWEWRGNPGHVRAGVAGDGSLRVAGVDAQGLYAAAVDTAGRTLWNRNIVPAAVLGPIRRLLVPLVDTTGATWIVVETEQASAPILAVISATGETRFVRNRSALAQPPETTLFGVASLAPGNELILSRRGTISRVGTDGTLRFERPLLPDDNGPSEPLAQIAQIDAQGTATFVSNLSGRDRFVRLSATGSKLPGPVTEGPLTTPTYVAHTALPDGSEIAWSRNTLGTRELLRLRPDGTVAWRVPSPGTWSLGAGSRIGALAAAGDRFCTLDARQADPETTDMVLSCHATADGAPLWSLTLMPAVGYDDSALPSQLALAADGTVSAWYATDRHQEAVHYARVDRNGTAVATKSWQYSGLYIGLAQGTPFAFLSTAADGIVVDRMGDERYRIAGNDFYFGTIAFDANGGLVAATRSAPQTTLLQRYDATGAKRWTRTIAPTSTSRIPLAVGADSVFVSSCCKLPGYPNQSYTLTRLALETGDVTWAKDYPARSMQYALALAPAGDAVVSLHSTTAGKTTVDVVEADNGALRQRRSEACLETACLAFWPIVDASGRLHFVEVAEAETSTLVSWQLPPRGATNIRLDQPGVTGGWWAPYANGEGFVLDWLPASRTLFMPWFTFSIDGGNDPAGQRWYSIAGEVPANATRVELPILEASGGAFDDPQAVVRRQVGKAVLNFTDCDNGTLQYAFDAPTNAAAAGTITLSRLTPATQDCLLADGTTQVRGTTPANGFDARMSGSWYEEATSGQGLQFTVQPGGIFFAPWFAFDPKGASDDPDNKRWFSIQGSLANAVNGRVELPIGQAIGGAFDRIPTNNMTVAGKATLTMHGCDSATIDYRFDDNDLAGAMRGKAGTLDLIKAGGCTP